MNSFAVILAPLALLLPVLPATLPGPPAAADEIAHSAPEEEKSAQAFSVTPPSPLRLLEEARQPRSAGQVRIEQRVIIRIAPSSRQRSERSFAELDAGAGAFEEVRFGECVPINMIAAATPHDGRLMLFMRDRRVLSARLERSCNAEDFYAGFYVERQDGRLCEGRDRLQSRAGASCRISRLNRMVPVRD